MIAGQGGVPDRRPIASVIIPVRDDPAGLDRCLAAVLRQDCGRDRFEVIVVDDGSALPLVPMVGVRYLRQAPAGSYAARNLGIAAARGDVLAFTDADCMPEPDWLSAALSGLNGRVDLYLAGEVRFVPRTPGAPNVFELYDSLTFLQQRYLVEQRRFGATANLIVPAALMARVGPFRADLQSGGDGEWGARASRLGVAGRFHREATVCHPARATFAQLRRKWRRVLTGFADLHVASRGRPDYRAPSEVFPAQSWERMRALPPARRLAVILVALLLYLERRRTWFRLNRAWPTR